MEDEKKPDLIEDDKYLESFDSSDKKRKIIIVAVAAVLALVLAAVFYFTIGSLSEMSTETGKAFQENPPSAADGQKAP